MLNVNSIVANNIKKLKEEKSLTYGQLGEFMGMRESSVRNMVSGRSRFNLVHIGKLCEALNCPVGRLFIQEEKPPEETKSLEEKELGSVCHKLSDRSKKSLIDYAHYLLSEENREDKKATGTDPPFN